MRPEDVPLPELAVGQTVPLAQARAHLQRAADAPPMRCRGMRCPLLSDVCAPALVAPAQVEMSGDVTSPPEYLSEADLISLMEKHGIGTDASIPSHIKNIVDRRFARISEGGRRRRVEPTELGISLVQGYMAIDPELVRPTIRSHVEKELSACCSCSSRPPFGAAAAPFEQKTRMRSLTGRAAAASTPCGPAQT